MLPQEVLFHCRIRTILSLLVLDVRSASVFCSSRVMKVLKMLTTCLVLLILTNIRLLLPTVVGCQSEYAEVQLLVVLSQQLMLRWI